MNAEAFAAGQQRRMEGIDEELLPVVQRAVDAYTDDDSWLEPIMRKAASLYEEASTYPAPTTFQDTLRRVLAKTKDPDDTFGDTALRVTMWVATYITHAAEFVAGDSGTAKQWITMHDDRVRESHAALDGATVPSGEKFQVGDVKLRYPGEPVGDPKEWIYCRCVLQVLKEDAMTAAAPGPITDDENIVPTPDPADLPAEQPDDAAVDQDTLVPFHGVATVVDRPTGDRRQLAREGYAVRPMPLPVFYQRAQEEGHGGSTIVGQFTRMELNDAGEVEFDGHYNYTPEAAEAIQGVAEGWLRGVSVDLDDVLVDYAQPQPALAEDATDADVMDAMQQQVTVFKQWRVAGLTIVGIPAFHEGYIALGTRADVEAKKAAAEVPHEEAGDGIHDEDTVPAEPVLEKPKVKGSGETETFAPGTHDGPGWITNPVPTGRIRRYWTHGEGAAKIRWGVPGDFNRCRTQIAKYIANPEWLAGTCANMHKEAIGVWPGQEDGSHAIRHSLLASGQKMAAAFNLVASAGPRELPAAAMFANPELTGPTPITIEGDRVFGHIATWGTCHLGFGGTCTEAPRSETNYSWFRLGGIQTDQGVVPVGQITLGTGHAGLREGATSAAAHYDNTGTAIADIATGEDDHGIWFSGRIRPSATEDQRAELLGAKLSGDWREIRGNLELVAALAVNTPGFGIPRLGLAASGEKQYALVAAGIVEAPVDTATSEVPVVHPDFDRMIREGVETALRRRDRVAALSHTTAHLRELAEGRRRARVMAARARLGR